VRVATVCLVCFGLFVAGCGPDKVEKAIAGLTDESESVREKAVFRLQTIGDQRAIEPLIEDASSIDCAWRHLRRRLYWSLVMTSKCLHFLVRSLGCKENPVVPPEIGHFYGGS